MSLTEYRTVFKVFMTVLIEYRLLKEVSHLLYLYMLLIRKFDINCIQNCFKKFFNSLNRIQKCLESFATFLVENRTVFEVFFIEYIVVKKVSQLYYFEYKIV